MRLILAAEHAGAHLRMHIAEQLEGNGHSVLEVGAMDETPVDYPPIIREASTKLIDEEFELGIFICGTGIGVSLAASKVPGIYPALCTNEYMARMSRAHNDANVLCMGSRVIGYSLAESIVKAFITTPFDGGRHARRVNQIYEIERAVGGM